MMKKFLYTTAAIAALISVAPAAQAQDSLDLLAKERF